MTSRFETQDPDFERRVRDSFVRQRVMETLGARLTHVGPGVANIELPFRSDLTQQHGFVHAGILATIADSACGYAAFTLMSADAAVLSVEFKVNLLSPAKGELVIARGRVRKFGRTISVCEGDVYARTAGKEKLVATMVGTMMTVRDRPHIKG